MVETCTAKTTRGKACSAQAWRAGLCRWHHPGLEVERAAWRERGGRNRSTASRAARRLPKELSDVKTSLLRALANVEDGSLEPQRATAMATLAKAVLAVDERGDLETRLATLEQAVSTSTKGRSA